MRKLIWLFILIAGFYSPRVSDASDFARLPRGMFVSVIQDPPTLSSKEEIHKLIKYCKRSSVKYLFVQIYRSGKSYFPSQVVDDTPYRDNLKKLGMDSFALLIEEAHNAGIEVHAWLNMLSLGGNTNAKLLEKYGPEILTQNLKVKKAIEDYKIDNQLFLEPGDLRVRTELADMVREILAAYPTLDGLQFDYIRYPDEHPHYGFAPMNVKRYKEAAGQSVIDEESEIWKDWKRTQVTELLEQLIQAARSIRPKIQVSTTGCMSYIRAYHEAYQDWPSWVNHGLIDFVTIMTYPADVSEFERYLADAKSHVDDFNKVKIAIPAYKTVASPKIFFEEWELCQESGGGACVVFHYGSLTESKELYDFMVS